MAERREGRGRAKEGGNGEEGNQREEEENSRGKGALLQILRENIYLHVEEQEEPICIYMHVYLPTSTRIFFISSHRIS